MKQRLLMAASTALVFVAAGALDAQRTTQRESHGEVQNRVTVTTIVAAIDNTPRVTARLGVLGNLTPDRIRVVEVRSLVPTARRGTYLAALERNVRKIEDLRAELVTFDPVIKVLAARKPSLTVDDVVGAGILDVIETSKSSNVLVLYVDNRNQVSLMLDGRRTVAVTGYRPTSAALLSALYVTPEMVARVSALEAPRAERIRFFNIDSLLRSGDVDAYAAALRTNETSIRSLRAELSKWPVVLTAMQRHAGKLALGDIFAADIVGGGDLVLYYKRAG